MIRRIALLFYDLSTRCGKGVSPTSRPPLPPGKTRYPLYRRLRGSQGRCGRAENLVPTGIQSRTVQAVVSRYNDWDLYDKFLFNSVVNGSTSIRQLFNTHNSYTGSQNKIHPEKSRIISSGPEWYVRRSNIKEISRRKFIGNYQPKVYNSRSNF